MKCLVIQLHPSMDTSFTEQDVIKLVRSVGRFPEIDIDDEQDNLINLNFFSEDLPLLWADLKAGFETNKDLGNWISKVAIIACEGEDGWDDALLLAHYDKSELLDEF